MSFNVNKNTKIRVALIFMLIAISSLSAFASEKVGLEAGPSFQKIWYNSQKIGRDYKNIGTTGFSGSLYYLHYFNNSIAAGAKAQISIDRYENFHTFTSARLSADARWRMFSFYIERFPFNVSLNAGAGVDFTFKDDGKKAVHPLVNAGIQIEWKVTNNIGITLGGSANGTIQNKGESIVGDLNIHLGATYSFGEPEPKHINVKKTTETATETPVVSEKESVKTEAVVDPAEGHNLTGWMSDHNAHWKECYDCDGVFYLSRHIILQNSNRTYYNPAGVVEIGGRCIVCGYEVGPVAAVEETVPVVSETETEESKDQPVFSFEQMPAKKDFQFEYVAQPAETENPTISETELITPVIKDEVVDFSHLSVSVQAVSESEMHNVIVKLKDRQAEDSEDSFMIKIGESDFLFHDTERVQK